MRRFPLLFLLLTLPVAGWAQERVTMLLGTVGGGPGERVNLVGGQLPEDHPGWFIELTQRAANDCGADVDFAFMPWSRVLKQVEKGALAAAFNSSWKPDRAVYGVYPLLNGEPDERRSAKSYAYYAYVRNDAAAMPDLAGLQVIVERDSAIIPLLEKRGAIVRQIGSYVSMFRMLTGGRVSLAVGIGSNLDPVLSRNGDLAAEVRKLEPPLVKKVGYVMFSKPFHAAHQALVECFWETSAQLRETAWFADLRASYRQ